MRTYASISPMFWTRGSGKRLRGDTAAQVVALYLMTSPATSMVGIFHLALPTLCHETGLTLQGARKGLQRVSEEGIAHYDEAEELVFVPALAKHQVGETLTAKDKKVRGVIRALEPFKSHRFYSLFVERYASAFSLPESEITRPSEAPSESLPRDYVPVPVLSCPDPESGVVLAAKPDAEQQLEANVADVFEFWKTDTGHSDSKLTAEKRKHLRARLKDFSVEQLKQVVRNRHLSPHYMGQNDSGTVYDGIDNLFRNTERVEKLLALSRKNGSAQDGANVYMLDAEGRLVS